MKPSKNVPLPLAFSPVSYTMHDPRDEFVLELAVAAGCQAIVTHNTRDFAGTDRFGVEVLTPGQFLRRLEEG